MSGCSLTKVLRNGMCIGCGVCGAVAGSIGMRWTHNGFLVASPPKIMRPEDKDRAAQVCPFSDAAVDEDTLAAAFYREYCENKTDELGWFAATYVAYVTDESLRARASSGGLGRWLLSVLLDKRLVDGCVHVQPGASSETLAPPLFEYAISRTREDVLNTARSAYYPVHLRRVLQQVRQQPGSYVITGVPCFIKATRLLQRQDPVFRDRIRFTVGIFCGHMKNRLYAEMLAWQVGMPGSELHRVDFRDKSISRTAKQKGFVATGHHQRRGPVFISELFGGDYNLGFFQYRACDYCDDVAAETADIAIGDAWLPEQIADPRGTSILVVRNRDIHELLRWGRDSGELILEPVAPERVVESQAGAFRQRREGLAYRLYLDERAGRWHPAKRVKASHSHMGRKRKAIYRCRMQLREASVPAFLTAKLQQDFEIFRQRMAPMVRRYRALYGRSILERAARRLRLLVRRFFSRIG